MKNKLCYLIALCFLFFNSCDKESLETVEPNIEYQNTLESNKMAGPKQDCSIGYVFNGSIGIDNNNQNNFLFTWDFSNALLACDIELAIEFRTFTDLHCPGNFTPGGVTSSHYQHFPLVNIDNYGFASVYFNPIHGSMIHNKTFEYRTIITGRSCTGTSSCTTIGPWQGPLCSYNFP